MAGKKYFTLSFDDGVEQDKRLIEVLKQYDMPCTFNLSSGLFGDNSFTAHIGEIGFMDLKEENRIRRKLFKTVEHDRIPLDEAVQVYTGYEIASHDFTHTPVKGRKADEIRESTLRDREELSRIFGQPITGYAYPGGISSRAGAAVLRENGFLFGRGAFSSGSFQWPENPFEYKPTCSHKDKKIFELLDAFDAAQPGEDDLLFMVWGHAYEFDYGMENTSLDHFKRVMDKVKGMQGLTFCTNSEAFGSHANR